MLLLFFTVRFAGLGRDIINTDAPRWHRRSNNFASALVNLNLKDTYQHYQPGVSLMWLTWDIKLLVHRGMLEHADFFPTIHTVSKTAVVLTLTFLLLVQMHLIEKLFSSRTALLFGVFMSLEPYLIGIDRWFHLTSLEVYLAFSCFLTLLWWLYSGKNNWIYVSAGFLGLSVLSKLTTLMFLPLFLFLIIRKDIKKVPIFLGIALLTFVLLFPAIWVDAAYVFSKLYNAISGAVVGGLRQETINVHPWAYYLVIFALKISPITLLVFLLGLANYKKIKAVKYILLYIFIYFVGLSIVGQKIDRYVLGFIPPVLLICSQYISKLKLKVFVPIVVGVVLFFTFVFVRYHPVYSAYYSPVFGGQKNALNLGIYDNSGEYYLQAADYLNDLQQKFVVFVPYNIESFSYYYKGVTVREFSKSVGYVVKSIDWDRKELKDNTCPVLEKSFGTENIVGVFKCS